MSLQQKLARYQSEKPGFAVAIEGPLTAARLVDVHADALRAGTPVTVLHEGAPTEVALRMAARFGIALVDAASLPDLPAEAAPASIPQVAPVPVAAPVLAQSRVRPVALKWPIPAPIAPPAAPALPAPAPEPLLPAHIEAAAPAPRAEITIPVVVTPPPAPPEPLCAGLPWDPSTPSESSRVTIEVTAFELAALPWHAHAPIEEHTEIIESPVARRRAPIDHPTTDLHPHGASWGLPWPRPVPPMDAISKADPAVWNMPTRIQAVRDDLESRISTPAPKLDANWLKRLQG